MGQNSHTGSMNVLPSSPVISEMAILLAMFLYYQNMKPILTKHGPPLHEVFRQSAMPKMTVEACDHFMVLVKKAFCDSKYKSNLHF